MPWRVALRGLGRSRKRPEPRFVIDFARGEGYQPRHVAMNPVWGDELMTQHASLKSANKISAKRNVMKRFERIDFLRASGKWKEGDRGLGLPKTKPQV